MPRRRRRTTIDENKTHTHTQCKYCCVLYRSFKRTRSCCNFLFGDRIKERKRTSERASDTQYWQKEKFVIKLRDASKRMQCSDLHDKRQQWKKVFFIYKNINKRRQSGKMAYKNYESQWKRRAEVKYELWSLKCFSVIFSLVLLLSFFIHQSHDFVIRMNN